MHAHHSDVDEDVLFAVPSPSRWTVSSNELVERLRDEEGVRERRST